MALWWVVANLWISSNCDSATKPVGTTVRVISSALTRRKSISGKSLEPRWRSLSLAWPWWFSSVRGLFLLLLLLLLLLRQPFVRPARPELSPLSSSACLVEKNLG